MPKLVQPETFLLGYTTPDMEGLTKFLEATGRVDFLADFEDAVRSGIHPGEALCSMYAKLCYASIVPGQNANLRATRSIRQNLIATMDSAHGSVFEHLNLNFVTTRCSRVFTHELIRHRVGTAFSQTSGRYCRGETIEFVHDPILDLVKGDIQDLLEVIELRYCDMVKKMGMGDPRMDFDRKKKLTSALRRVLPNGQSNEMGFSANIRTLRHLLMLRTHRSAEWEIRVVFGDVFELVRHKFPMMFYDARTRVIDGTAEVYGMRIQPYEKIAEA